MSDPLELVRDRLAEHGCGPRDGKQFDCRCPAHDDRSPSLSVGTGDDGRVLLRCQAGCELEDVVAALGLTMQELFPSQNGNGDGRRVVDRYVYEDADGAPVLRVLRMMPKGFWQQRPNGKGGWIKGGVPADRRVLYRLPKVIAAIGAGDPIWLVEGEKDAHALERAGVVATTNPGGAEKWLPQYTEALHDANVIVIADNDEPGIEHARYVAKDLAGVAKSVELRRCPDPHKDASDLLAAGGKLDDLEPLPLAEDDGGGGQRKSVVTLASNVRSRRVRWAWKGYMPLGYLTIQSGESKLGKSTFFCHVAAQLAHGKLPGEFFASRLRC